MTKKSFNDKPGLLGSWRAIRMAMVVGFGAAPGRMTGLAVLRLSTEFGAPLQAWGLKLLTDAVTNGIAAPGSAPPCSWPACRW